MDEERLRMRRELVRQARQGNKKSTETGGKQFFLFRIYVTMMLVGAAFMLSLFDTDTANTITESLKEAIAYEMPLETIQEWKDKAITVFHNTQKQTNQNIQQDTQQQNEQNSETQSIETQNKSNAFQPDLNENTGKIP